MKALHSDPSAIWGLIGLSAAYGVFHAAGPGHGKALIASYMFANERALRRGVVLAFLAALLQALVAIALIGIAALVFRATEIGMNRASNIVEIGSYLCVAGVGVWLVWAKGRAFAGALRLAFADRADAAWRALSPARRGAPPSLAASPRSFASRRRALASPRRPNAAMPMRPILRRLATVSPGAARRRLSSPPARGLVRERSSC